MVFCVGRGLERLLMVQPYGCPRKECCHFIVLCPILKICPKFDRNNPVVKQLNRQRRKQLYCYATNFMLRYITWFLNSNTTPVARVYYYRQHSLFSVERIGNFIAWTSSATAMTSSTSPRGSTWSTGTSKLPQLTVKDKQLPQLLPTQLVLPAAAALFYWTWL